jgi:hypothetical protein
MKNETASCILATGLMLMLGLAGCGQQAALFKPTASIQEIMLSVIDPNIDYVWNSVASVVTKSGTEERKPTSAEDWAAVRQHALVVLEASNLLLIEGRHVAANGATTSNAAAELTPKEIEKLIAANRDDFIKYAHALHDAVQRTLVAIDARNAEELVTTGGAVDRVCEQCHKRFWYPGDKIPTLAVVPKKS